MCNIIITTILFIFNRKMNAPHIIWSHILFSVFYFCTTNYILIASSEKTSLLQWLEQWNIKCAWQLCSDETRQGDGSESGAVLNSQRRPQHWDQAWKKPAGPSPGSKRPVRSTLIAALGWEGLLRPHPEWEVKSWGERPSTCSTEFKLKRNTGPHKR